MLEVCNLVISHLQFLAQCLETLADECTSKVRYSALVVDSRSVVGVDDAIDYILCTLWHLVVHRKGDDRGHLICDVAVHRAAIVLRNLVVWKTRNGNLVAAYALGKRCCNKHNIAKWGSYRVTWVYGYRECLVFGQEVVYAHSTIIEDRVVELTLVALVGSQELNQHRLTTIDVDGADILLHCVACGKVVSLDNLLHNVARLEDVDLVIYRAAADTAHNVAECCDLGSATLTVILNKYRCCTVVDRWGVVQIEHCGYNTQRYRDKKPIPIREDEAQDIVERNLRTLCNLLLLLFCEACIFAHNLRVYCVWLADNCHYKCCKRDTRTCKRNPERAVLVDLCGCRLVLVRAHDDDIVLLKVVAR